jgi:hypothetical protein
MKNTNEYGVFYTQNTAATLRADANSDNQAFTTFEDMLLDAINRHEKRGPAYKYSFVSVHWGLINGKPINVVGMLRVHNNAIEFTHLEEGRREFRNYALCEEAAASYKMPRPSRDEKIRFSIEQFNRDIKEEPNIVYGWGFNLTTVPYDDSPTSDKTLLLLASSVISLNEKSCRKEKQNICHLAAVN